MIFIFRAVGEGQPNLENDVATIQTLLNARRRMVGGMPLLKVDRHCGPQTLRAIRLFQRRVMHLRPDGVIRLDGPTFRALVGPASVRTAGATSGAATTPAAASTSAAAAVGPDGSEAAWTEADYLARTLYGEARGENVASKTAVAWVIRNRIADGRWGTTYRSVVTARLQFTCWSRRIDPGNYAAIHHPRGSAWDDCQAVARAVIAAAEKDNVVPEATHYYSPKAQKALHGLDPDLYPETPAWAAASAEQVPNPPGVPENSYRFYRNVR